MSQGLSSHMWLAATVVDSRGLTSMEEEGKICSNTVL